MRSDSSETIQTWWKFVRDHDFGMARLIKTTLIPVETNLKRIKILLRGHWSWMGGNESLFGNTPDYFRKLGLFSRMKTGPNSQKRKKGIASNTVKSSSRRLCWFKKNNIYLPVRENRTNIYDSPLRQVGIQVFEILSLQVSFRYMHRSTNCRFGTFWKRHAIPLLLFGNLQITNQERWCTIP